MAGLFLFLAFPRVMFLAFPRGLLGIIWVTWIRSWESILDSFASI